MLHQEFLSVNEKGVYFLSRRIYGCAESELSDHNSHQVRQ